MSNIFYLPGCGVTTLADEAANIDHLLSKIEVQLVNIEMYTPNENASQIETIKSLVDKAKIRMGRVSNLAKEVGNANRDVQLRFL